MRGRSERKKRSDRRYKTKERAPGEVGNSQIVPLVISVSIVRCASPFEFAGGGGGEIHGGRAKGTTKKEAGGREGGRERGGGSYLARTSLIPRGRANALGRQPIGPAISRLVRPSRAIAADPRLSSRRACASAPHVFIWIFFFIFETQPRAGMGVKGRVRGEGEDIYTAYCEETGGVASVCE